MTTEESAAGSFAGGWDLRMQPIPTNCEAKQCIPAEIAEMSMISVKQICGRDWKFVECSGFLGIGFV